MKLQDYAEQAFEKLQQLKKISPDKVSVQDLKDVFHVIDVVNSLGIYAKRLDGGFLLSEYEIPAEWNSLIYPKWFSFGGDESNPDLLDRPFSAKEAATAKVISPDEFASIMGALLNMMKRSGLVEIKRDDVETLQSNVEYYFGNKYMDTTEVPLDRRFLDKAKVGSVIDTSNHTRDITSKYIRRMFEVLAER